MHYCCALLRLCAICLKTMETAYPGKPKRPSQYLLHRIFDTFLCLFKTESFIPMRVIILFASSAVALLIPPPIVLSENLTVASSAADDRAANISVYDTTKCLPKFYGVDLNVQSCMSAVEKIPRTIDQSVYGTRGFPGISIMIPMRYQSDDSLCAITLRLRNRDGTGRDVTRSIDVADAAQAVIKKCAVPSRSKSGGSAHGFST